MLDEKKLQHSIDARLSGLSASDARRARIRHAVRTQEPEGTHMKRKLSLTLAVALMATLLAATFAIAEGLNLFSFFGREDGRYAQVAQEAILPTTAPVTVPNAPVGAATAVIDSAYFDGMTCSITLRIDHYTGAEPYTPTAEELAAMDTADPQPLTFDPEDPYADIYRALNTAIESGTPCGYREWTIAPSDHVLTDDGIDLPPTRGIVDITDDGAWLELREFEYPLPEAVQDRGTLSIRVKLNRYVSTVYFDGTRFYHHSTVEDAGLATAIIPRAATQTRTMTGEGQISGVPCRVTALVSPMSVSVTLVCDAPLNTFLAAPPEGMDPYDAWVDMTAVDETGTSLRPTCGASLDDRTEVRIDFNGTGRMPETLTVNLYTTWEGPDAPNHPEGAGITIR